MSVHIERRVGWKLWHHKKEDTPEEAYKREIGPPKWFVSNRDKLTVRCKRCTSQFKELLSKRQ